MKKLQVIDMTLRQTANTGSREMTFKDKLEIARILDRLKVDAIELAPITGSKAEQLTNRTVASMVSARVSAAVEVSAGNIEETWDSIRNAKEPSLNLPGSVYNMLPYIVSLVVLALTSKNSHAPKAEGIPYDKGMR